MCLRIQFCYTVTSWCHGELCRKCRPGNDYSVTLFSRDIVRHVTMYVANQAQSLGCIWHHGYLLGTENISGPKTKAWLSLCRLWLRAPVCLGRGWLCVFIWGQERLENILAGQVPFSCIFKSLLKIKHPHAHKQRKHTQTHTCTLVWVWWVFKYEKGFCISSAKG